MADEIVVKTLRKVVLKKPVKFACHAMGLAREGAILGLLDHPHIIKLYGTSLDGLPALASGWNDAYFLVMERLEETLTDRIQQWKKQ